MPVTINLDLVADAAGTVDVITATYNPAPPSLYDGLLLFFFASGANTSTTPTFNPNTLGARTIVKKGGTALVAGDIPGANALMCVAYDLGNTRWELLNAAVGNNYKVYKALLTQSGTDAPVATVLENTLGTVTWLYSSVGDYFATSANLFTIGKTVLRIHKGDCPSLILIQIDDVVLSLTTYDSAGLQDNSLLNTSVNIEIQVYP